MENSFFSRGNRNKFSTNNPIKITEQIAQPELSNKELSFYLFAINLFIHKLHNYVLAACFFPPVDVLAYISSLYSFRFSRIRLRNAGAASTRSV